MAAEALEILDRAKREGWTDLEVIERVKNGETALYEIIMRRYNQRLYRVARAILRNDDETEDVVQDAYVRAYQHLAEFRGEAPFGGWLTRIAVNEALRRLRSRGRNQQMDEDDGASSMNITETSPNPEQQASTQELGHLLETAILDLPDIYRIVVMLRDVEEMNTTETAHVLDLTEENVKVRLHRGRAMIRRWLFARVGPNAKEAFSFMGVRCDRVVAGTFVKLGNLEASHTLQ